MRGTDIVIIVIAVAAIAVAYAVGASRSRRVVRGSQARFDSVQDRADLLEARIQALDAYRTSTKTADPVTLAAALLALRGLAQQRLDILDPPPAPDPLLVTGQRVALRVQVPLSLAPPTPRDTPAGDLAEDLRALIRDIDRSAGDEPAFAGRTPASLRTELRADADFLDRSLAVYSAATA